MNGLDPIDWQRWYEQSGQALPDGEQRCERSAEEQDPSHLCEAFRDLRDEIQQRADNGCDNGDSHLHGDTPEQSLAPARPAFEARKIRRLVRQEQEREREQERAERRAAIKLQALAAKGRSDDAAFWEWYDAYRETPAWRKKRWATIERARGICEDCGVAPATDAHHLTYRNVGDEQDGDLCALCRQCHDLRHARGQR